jgi:hypothetical protein
VSDFSRKECRCLYKFTSIFAKVIYSSWLLLKVYLKNNILISYLLRRIIEAKLNVEPELLRGATFEERFFDDTILLR